jgi:MFS family permease
VVRGTLRGELSERSIDTMAGAKGYPVHRFYREIERLSREMRLYLLYTLLVNIGIGVFILIYNLYLVQISLKEDFIGTFNAVQTVAMGIAALLMGIAINRYGTWRCTTYGTLFFLVSSVFLSILTDPSAILVVSALNGAGLAFMTVPVMPFIVEWAAPEALTMAAALTFSLNSISSTIGSLVGGWSPRVVSSMLGVPLESVVSYRFTLIIGIALATFGMLPLWVMRHIRDHDPADVAQSSVLVEMPTSTRRVRRDMSVFVLVGLIMSLGTGAVVPFVNVFLESLGSNPDQIGIIFSIAGVVAAIASLFAPVLYRKFGALISSMFIRLMAAPIYLLLAFSPQTGIAIAAQVVRTTSVSMAWPIDSSFISDVLPPRARANAFSLRSGAWNLGYALSSVVAGELIVASGYRLTFVAYGVSMIIAVATYVAYFWKHPTYRKHRNKQPNNASVSATVV